MNQSKLFHRSGELVHVNSQVATSQNSGFSLSGMIGTHLFRPDSTDWLAFIKGVDKLCDERPEKNKTKL